MRVLRQSQIRAFLKIAFFSIIALPVFHDAARAQDSPTDSLPRIRFVVLDDYVRDILARDWDAHSRDTVLLERGYCLGYQLDFWAGEIAYRVTQISAADSVSADSSSISFSCTGKFTGHLAELHVHPPTSCLGAYGPCFRGGPYAFQCKESDQDLRWLAGKRQPFAMIQCSREAVIYFLATSRSGP